MVSIDIDIDYWLSRNLIANGPYIEYNSLRTSYYPTIWTYSRIFVKIRKFLIFLKTNFRIYFQWNYQIFHISVQNVEWYKCIYKNWWAITDMGKVLAQDYERQKPIELSIELTAMVSRLCNLIISYYKLNPTENLIELWDRKMFNKKMISKLEKNPILGELYYSSTFSAG